MKRWIALALVSVMLLCGCSNAAVVSSNAAPRATDVPEPAVAAAEAAGTVSAEAGAKADMQQTYPVNEPPEQGNVISVSDVNGLLASIGPDRTIYLEAGDYALTEAADYGQATASDYYSWEEVYDGFALSIHNVENLHILGRSADSVKIHTSPRYANVMGFLNCRNISVQGITAGHTDGPGSCAGAVLYFDAATGVTVTENVLFGCGTIGVEASACENLLVQNCLVTDCSLGAVSFLRSRNVEVRDCRLRDCGGEYPAYALLYAAQSEAVAVVNCEISGNSCERLLESSYSRDVYLLGCGVKDNAIAQCAFLARQYNPVVEGCAFENNRLTQWYAEEYEGEAALRAVSLSGAEWTDADLQAMQRQDVPYEAPAATPDTAETPADGQMRTVQASNMDEFLAAIASDTTVYLADGVYSLSDASDYGTLGQDAYYWQENYDGPGLVISGVSNFHIVGGGADKVSINAVPRYADVITLDSCDNVSITGVTLGHFEKPGECSGGVLRLVQSRSIAVSGCGLYGCGILGVNAEECEAVTVENTEIYDCSQGAAYLYACNGVAFTGCSIHDCGEPEFSVSECENVTRDGKPIES